MSRALVWLLFAAGLAAMLPLDEAPAEPTRPELHYAPAPRPATSAYGVATPAATPPMPSAATLRALSAVYFDLEQGPARTRLFRWRPPIRVAVGDGLDLYRDFLAEFIAEIRARSGLDVSLASGGGPEGVLGGILHVRLAPTFGMMRRLGGALCVATLGDVDWDGYRDRLDAARESGAARAAEIDWARASDPRAATIFLPDRARPYQVRACLMEEILQSLGPSGDHYALDYSIFNDDGAHLRPTAFDWAALRLLYDPTLAQGAARAEAETTLLRLIDRAGPHAARRGPADAFAVDAEWRAMVRAGRSERHPFFALRLYARAVDQARARFGPVSPATLFVETEAAILSARTSAREAWATLTALRPRVAARFAHDGGLRTARIDLALAEIALGGGDGEAARARAEAALGPLVAHALDDQIARAHLIISAARRGDRRIHPGQEDENVTAEAWRLYAFGAPRQAVLRRAALEASPEPERSEPRADGTVALFVAVFAAAGGVLGCLGVVVWVVRARRA